MNFYQDGPTCEPRINATLPCIRIDQCTPNAECLRDEESVTSGDSPVFTCQCQEEFYKSSELHCLQLKNVSLPCTDSRECTHGASCEFRAQEGLDVCVCEPGYYQDGESCRHLRGAGQACTDNGQCIPNTTCTGVSLNFTQLSSLDPPMWSGINSSCACDPGFYQDGLDCQPLIPVDLQCRADNQCTFGAYCDEKSGALVCICSSEHFRNGSFCTPLKNASTLCTSSGQCIFGAECVSSNSSDTLNNSKVCKCDEDYYEDSRHVCQSLINASQSCDFDSQCTSGADCMEIVTGFNNCVCRQGTYFEDEFHKCTLLLNASSPCNGVGQCIYGAECTESGLNRSCVCEDNFYEDTVTHTCQLLKSPFAKCKGSNECVVGAYCKNYKEEILNDGVCTCVENLYYQHGLECRERINATLPCSDPGQCILGASCRESSKVSTPSSYECVCDNGFYLHRKSCHMLKNVSEPCTAKGQCSLGSECLREVGSSVCSCIDGYYHDFSQCKPKKKPGVSCVHDNHCIKEAECVPEIKTTSASMTHPTAPTLTEHLCQCRDGYYQQNSECLPLLNATLPCSAEGQCINGAACVESKENRHNVTMMTCSCLSTHYLKDQNCFLLINATKECSTSDQCVSGATCKEISINPSTASSSKSICVCDDGFYNKQGLCLPLINATDPCLLGDECINGAVCKFLKDSPIPSNSLETGICTCNDGFYLDGKECTVLKNVSDTCQHDYQCVKGALCLMSVYEQTCTCVGGYFQYDNKCKVFVNVTQPCDDKDNCVTNAICTQNAFDESFCTCLPDFYADDNRCFERISAGLSCERNETCTVGALCSPANNSCECSDDFFQSGLICAPLVEASKPCNVTEHCVENAICDGVTRKCQCISGFFETNGKCKESIDAGDKCIKTGTCTEFAECDVNFSSKCICNDGFYSDGGDCKELIPVDSTCSKPGQCISNATCSPKDYLCHCNNGFYKKQGKCYPLKFVDEKCKVQKDCIQNSICNIADGYVCTCLPSFFKDEYRMCSPLINASQFCNASEQCVKSSFCNNSTSLCSCNDGFYEKEGLCIAKIEAEKACNLFLVSEQCVNNSRCVLRNGIIIDVETLSPHGICKCDSGFYSDFGQCWVSITHSSPCNETRQCVENSECVKSQTATSSMSSSVDQQCQCVTGFYSDDQGYCLELVPAGEVCMETRQCTFDSSCSGSKGKCECDNGFYENVMGKCEVLIEAEKPCIHNSQCTFNATCPLAPETNDERRCVCESGFFSDDGLCEVLKAPGQSCYKTSECVEHSACSPFTSTCECLSNFYHTSQSLCAPLKLVDESCYEDRECTIDSTCINGSCTCGQEFYTEQSSQTCESLKPPNSQCEYSAQCTFHADCLFDITGRGKCICGTGYYVDIDMAVCKELIPTSRSCISTAQCTHNAQCIEFETELDPYNFHYTCECLPGFYETEENTCKEHIFAGTSCKSTEQCVASAVCSEVLQTSVSGIISNTGNLQNIPQQELVCECIKGYFSMHGHCLPLLTVGRHCNTTEQCVENSDCSTVFYDIKACVCRGDFYPDKIGQCQPKIPAGLPCSWSAQCRTRAFCNISQTLGVCQCDDGHYNNNGLCDVRVRAGKACDASILQINYLGAEQCTDFATCIATNYLANSTNSNTSGTCLCHPTHYNYMGVCKQLIGAEEME